MAAQRHNRGPCSHRAVDVRPRHSTPGCRPCRHAALPANCKGPTFTLFAPTNKAFAALPKGALANLLKPEVKAQLVKVLTSHVRVVSGNIHDTDFNKKEATKA